MFIFLCQSIRHKVIQSTNNRRVFVKLCGTYFGHVNEKIKVRGNFSRRTLVSAFFLKR